MKLDIEAIDDQAEKIADEKCQMPGEYHPDWHSVYAEAFARLIVERCAEECEAISVDKWALYKGRPPYTGQEPGRADPDTQGQSDGADSCATAIRNLLED